MVVEDAANVLACNNAVFEEAADLLAKLQHSDKEEKLLKMVRSCYNTMSDHGAVMKAFNKE